MAQKLFKASKLPNIGADQSVFNLQILDSIKQLNNQIKTLSGKIMDIEGKKSETFKYLVGNASKTRTVPNRDGEVKFRSGNNTVTVKTDGEYIDICVNI